MNSWKSTELSACAPPLSTFIIGTGRTCAPPRRRGSARAAGPPPPPRRAPRPARRRGSRSRPGGDLFGVPSSSISAAVEAALVGGVAAGDRLGDLAVDVADRLRDALAAVGVAAVAQLDRLELAGRGAGRHRGAARARRSAATTSTSTVGLPRRVEDLAGVDALDLAHRRHVS